MMAAVGSIGSDSLQRLVRNSGGAFSLNLSGGDNRGGASDSLTVNGDSTKMLPATSQPFAFEAPEIEFVPFRDMSDYLAPFSRASVKPDADANVWIALSKSSQARPGETIYDVVNNSGELFQRVRVPAGRSIAGFGHEGVVYLKYEDGANGWILERTRIVDK